VEGEGEGKGGDIWIDHCRVNDIWEQLSERKKNMSSRQFGIRAELSSIELDKENKNVERLQMSSLH
jgi:hypothetical protein